MNFLKSAWNYTKAKLKCKRGSWWGIGISVVSLAVNAYGQYQEGQDAKEASDYNAEISRQTATMTAESGALDASRQRTQVKRLIGTQKMKYAGSGVELTGSPLDVMINTAAEGELDAQIIEYNSKIKTTGALSQAAYDEKLGNIYARSGTTKAGTTILTEGTKIYTEYKGY